MTRHQAIVLCLIVMGVVLVLMALLAYAEWVGAGKAYGEMNERQRRRFDRRER